MGIEARTANYSLAKYARGSSEWDVGVNSNFDKIDLQMKSSADKIATLEGAASGALTGEVKLYAGISIPSGYLECNGASLLRADYPELFSCIGTTYGYEDANHFNLPDLRDRYPRGKSSTLSLGDEQEDAFQGHVHQIYFYPTGGSYNRMTTAADGNYPSNRMTTQDYAEDIASDGIHGTPRVAAETRPKTLVLTFIIKY